ncbi:MAG: hypothetical protein ACON5K_11190 [Bacteroidia bacterium]
MKGSIHLKYSVTIILSLVLLTCSKEIGELEEEFNLLESREIIISKIKSNDYDSYLKAFVDEAALYEIDLNYVYDGQINFYEDESPVDGWACWAWGRDRDQVLHVGINPDMFYDSTVTDYGRMWLIYHEFGHDIFNYRHTDPPAENNGDMMNPNSKRDSTKEEFMNVAEKMFLRFKSENTN